MTRKSVARRIAVLILSLTLGFMPVLAQNTTTTDQDQQKDRGLGLSTQTGKTPSPQQTTAGATRPELVLQTGVTTPAGQLSFSPDGRLLASMSVFGGTIKLWDTETGRELRTLNLGERSVMTSFMTSCFAFSPDGRQLVSFSSGQVKLWDAQTGRVSRAFMLPNAKELFSPVISPDARLLAAVDQNKSTVRLWELQTGRALPALNFKDDEALHVDALAFSPDGRLLATGGEKIDGLKQTYEVELWDVATGRRQQKIESSATKMSTSKTMTTFQTGGTMENVSRERGIAFSPDNRFIAVAIRDRTSMLGAMLSGMPSTFTQENKLQIFDLKTGRATTIKVSDAKSKSDKEAVYNAGRSFAFSSDSKLIVSVTNDKGARLFDPATGQQTSALTGHTQDVFCLTVSGDNRTVATGGLDNTIRLWDAQTGRETRRLGGGALPVESVAFSPDGRTLATGGKAVNIWELTTGVATRSLSLPDREGVDAFNPSAAFFNSDGRLIVAEDNAGSTVKLLDAKSGRELRSFPVAAGRGFGGGTLSSDGRVLVLVDKKSDGQKKDGTHTQPTSATPDPQTQAPATTMDPKELLKQMKKGGRGAQPMKMPNMAEMQKMQKRMEEAAAKGEMGKIMEMSQEMMKSMGMATGLPLPASPTLPASNVTLWDATTGQQLRALPASPNSLMQFGNNPVALSLDGRTLAAPDGATKIKLWDVSTEKENRNLPVDRAMRTSALAWSRDGRLLAAGTWETKAGVNFASQTTMDSFSFDSTFTHVVRVWDAEAGRELQVFNGHTNSISALAFSPDGKLLATGSDDSDIRLWDVTSGRQLSRLAGHTLGISSLSFSEDGKLLVSGSSDGSTRLWNTTGGELLATLVSLNKGADWLVVTPHGLFDGSPAAWNQILWRFSPSTFDVAPVELFFGEFYHPGLLADVVARKNPRPPQDISQKDRRQPQLKLTLADERTAAEGKVAARQAKVKVTVENAPAGAHDVRLFRNGSLVKAWRGDVLKGAAGVTLDATVALAAGENRLTAYAFNRDNIKSADETLMLTGADNLKRAGTAYVLAIGVNRYANDQYNLRYAVADAEAFGEELRRQQTKLARFANTEVITLRDEEATKANIVTALKRLTGAETLPASAPASLQKLKPAQPEDAVIIYFAGHGTAQQNQFYLIPHDLGHAGARTQIDAAGLQSILKHSISDREIEQLVEGVDAGQLLLVIDACNSGQALEAEERRRGPMNSKGLAQLAYEKGMYILTAAQGYQAALEAAQLGHGYLTYALVEEGLKTAAADAEPRDGRVIAREWLDYATARVPQMQEAKMKTARDIGLQVAFVEGEEGVKEIENRSVQRPRIFYRRDAEAQPLIIASP
ncbi:MAG TPA: caspase family protein [Pyrinomonadaceae bacterium]|nr:caspase family protein [Pyrinomonadaceae bacterium]